MKINEVDKVTTLAPAECITAIAADGSLIQIPVSELGKVMAQVMPVATRERNGLMSRDGLMIISSDLGHDDLTKVGTSCGYAYAEGDGSGLAGPFISMKGGPSYIQFKASYSGSSLKVRVYNQTNNTWSLWKSISFT